MPEPSSPLAGRVEALASQTTVEIAGVSFTFRRLMAMEAYDVLEQIRTALDGDAVAKALNALPDDAGAAAVGAAVLTIFPRVVGKAELESIRLKMFRVVDYRMPGDSHPGPVVNEQGVDDSPRAFDKPGPLAVYRVLVQALAVNFFPSFRDALSQLAPSLGSADTGTGTTRT